MDQQLISGVKATAMKIDKSPVNGYALQFHTVASYRYPQIIRVSDGAILWDGRSGPYDGKLADAYAAFRAVAATCAPIEGATCYADLTLDQRETLNKLSRVFMPYNYGRYKIRDIAE